MFQNPLVIGALVVIGIALGYGARFFFARRSKESYERKLEDEFESARAKAKELVVSAKDNAASILMEAQKEEKERKQELRRMEERLMKKEDAIDKEKGTLETEAARLAKEFERAKSIEANTQSLHEKALAELERISGITREEARKHIVSEFQEANREELSKLLASLERDKRDAIEGKTLEIVTTAIQRVAREKIADVTTSIIPLPNEDIKGKIIGREGRNVRAFERATGVEVIIDETPETLVISSFDPMRRELAKLSLEKLMKDGRIQPARIEEVVEQTRGELEEHVKKVGEEAAYEVGILDLPKEIMHVLGKLNYRTSYGQNVLQHSIEMTHISGMIASELGLNVAIAKKGALLHDIGKAIDYEVEGSHVELGRKLLKKYNIDENIIQAMQSHHDDYPYAIPEAYVVAAADAISAARPGARRDTLEKYLKRLEEIETITKSFDGVKQAYAVSAGREVRVFVIPEKIDDFGAFELAKKIAGKIQSDVQYPGEIKVTVVRELRAVEYAK
ncbi:MAG: ribonuclease Y [Candidatus Jorgensenbacteria bacterium]|nr:ribonuclease Y [Candidatus Jorgensenbacteria bacterium]